MKRILKTLAALFGVFLWFLDFDNIMWYILVPGGILVWGLIEGLSWNYYLIAYGIYAAINFIGYLLGKSVDQYIDKRGREREEREHNPVDN